MTDALDTPHERLAEYGRLFDSALESRDRTTDGIAWRFQGGAGVESWVRDLAAREAACCPFVVSTISVESDSTVTWHLAADGHPIMQTILDEMFRLPEAVAAGLPALLARLGDRGLRIVRSDDGHRTTVSGDAIVSGPSEE